ncbi:ParB/RepB/Spo0J family partition protein [Stenotrophomonas terrae]|uniref:ParB/RepB/Spo0J family partition protein n=1 Tax=Stenotrophomonas terrae TaxID=405446 RepID=UPI00320A6E47
MHNQQTISVPLSRLQLSPNNSRKRRTATHIEATLQSLLAHGQLQNIVVSPAPTDGDYLVDAGGTRLLAFQLGRERGDFTDDHPVSCLEVSSHIALEVSTAENVIREPMHPADQFRAFQAMVDSSRTIAEVAAHFSVTETVVAQRLKLANVAPELFALYEEGEVNLDQLQALALSDDHAAQYRAWFGTKAEHIEYDWQRSPQRLRDRLTTNEIRSDSALARYVGLDVYKQAGGNLRGDLFSSVSYLSDAALLERLANEALEKLAQAERAAGWSWAEAHPRLDYMGRACYGYGPFSAEYNGLSDVESARQDEINARLQQIDDVLLDEDDSLTPDEAEPLQLESANLSIELAELEAKRETWNDEAKAATGVLIFLDDSGVIHVSRGRLKPGQSIADGKVTEAKQSGPKKPTLSADMLQRLEAHRAAAIRLSLSGSPRQALTLLLRHLITQVGLLNSQQRLLTVSATNQHASEDPQRKLSDVAASKARADLDKQQQAWKKQVPKKAAELTPWLEGLADADRSNLLAFLIALTLPASHNGPDLAVWLGINMADHWQPTPETFIGLVPKPLLAEACVDVAGKTAGEAVLAMKKAAAMAATAKHLADTGWLPKPLRGKGYALKGDAQAAPPASAKKPTKKASGKPTGAKKATSAGKPASSKRTAK